MKIMKKFLILFMSVLLLFNLNVSANTINNNERTRNYKQITAIEENGGTITPDGEIIEFTISSASGSQDSVAAPINIIFGAVKPQKSSFKFTITNVGVDKVDIVTIKWKLYDDIKNKYITGGSKTFKKVKPGNTYYTWPRSKSSTVQERIEVTGSAQDGKDTMKIEKVSTVR